MTIHKQFGTTPSITVYVTTKDLVDRGNKVEVNWSTCGSLSVKKARDFYNHFAEALDFARREALRIGAEL